MNVQRRITARRALRERRRDRGFTLVEIMVVITILGALAALVVPNLMGSSDKARRKEALIQISNIESACELHKLDTGKFPSSLEGLVSNVDGNSKWDGPYLKGKVPSDPWGEEFQYSPSSKYVTITSNGGGDGTISNRDTDD